HGMAERGHDLRNNATAHLRAIFIACDITDPMRLVLNLPLSSYQGEQAPGRRPLGAQAGDPIGHFHPFLPCFLEEDVTPSLKHVRQPRPSAVAHEGLTRREMALLDAPMADVNGLRWVL